MKDVRAHLTQHRELAYTTVMTILDRLEKRSAVSRKKSGRSFIYTPITERESLRHVAAKELIDNYFDGEPGNLMDWLKKMDWRPSEAPPQVFIESNLDTSLL